MFCLMKKTEVKTLMPLSLSATVGMLLIIHNKTFCTHHGMHRVHDNDVHDVGMLSRGVPCMDMHGEGVPGMSVHNHGFRFLSCLNCKAKVI